MTSLSWYYDASTQLFVSETGITKRFSSIRADTENSLADNVFMGVPPGNEFRIGVDWDNDGLTTGQEGTLVPPTFPLDPDSDGDGFA